MGFKLFTASDKREARQIKKSYERGQKDFRKVEHKVDKTSAFISRSMDFGKPKKVKKTYNLGYKL